MARVVLTANMQKYFPAQQLDVAGETLGDVLQAMEAQRPHFLAYVVDEHGAIRKHVNIFIDGHLHRAKADLSVALQPSSEIHIMQALSGG